MRQPEQHEEDGAHEQERTEESEVAQGNRLQGHESQESAHGSDIAHHERLGYLAQGLTDIRRMGEMGDEMQGIVDGDTYDDGRDANHDDGHLTVYEREHTQSEKPAPPDGDDNQQQMADTTEGEPEQHENQHHGQRDGEDAVGLDLPGIAHGDGGAACEGY